MLLNSKNIEPSSKSKKNAPTPHPPEKRILIFQEVSLPGSKILHFLKRKLFFYFRNWNSTLLDPSSKKKKKKKKTIPIKFLLIQYFLKRKLIFTETKTPIFWKTETSPENFYISGSRTFLYFRK